MWAGIYSLDLYCDNQNLEKYPYQYTDVDGIGRDKFGHIWSEFPHQYTAERGEDCRRKARKAGWILGNDGSAICPKCSKKLISRGNNG